MTIKHPSEQTLALYLGGALDGHDRASIDTHLHECADCAAAVEQLIETDRALRQMPAVAVSSQLARRVFARALVTEEHLPARRWKLVAAACLLVAAGAVAGAALSAFGRGPAPIVRDAEGPKFALLFAEGYDSLIMASAAERSQRYDDFMAWMQTIGDDRVRLGGSELDDTRGRTVGASADVTAPNLLLSGFLVIRASSYDEAERLARACPIVARGGQVLVRQLR